MAADVDCIDSLDGQTLGIKRSDGQWSGQAISSCAEENEEDKGQKPKNCFYDDLSISVDFAEAIDSFLEEAYSWYIKELRNQKIMRGTFTRCNRTLLVLDSRRSQWWR